MNITLEQILALVGKLDDSTASDTPRERFRKFLSDNLRDDVGRLRDYIQASLNTPGEQYNRALQDLVNYTGRLLGFDVTYGRYQGVSGEIGFDGHWKSPTGFHLVAEVKTSEVYAIKTATLVGYVDKLISDKAIPNWGEALGLYIVGRPDPNLNEFEKSIIGEKRIEQLRVISVDSLLSLAELMAEFDVSHTDILTVLRPSGPTANPLVKLISGLVSSATLAAEEKATAKLPTSNVGAKSTSSSDAKVGASVGSATNEPNDASESNRWIIPVAEDDDRTAEDWVLSLVVNAKMWSSTSKKSLLVGDRVCFYGAGKGVMANAIVRTPPVFKTHPMASPDAPSWVIELDEVVEYLAGPVVIDAALREKLDAFSGKDPSKPWSWFVQGTHKVTAHDFEVLTKH